MGSELAETSGTHPSRGVWPEVVFLEELHSKSHNSDMKTRLWASSMHEDAGTGLKKNGRRCSGLMSQKLKYLTVAEGRRSWFAEGLEGATVMRQQWSMMEVPCKFGSAFLQMDLVIWSGFRVSSMLRNTGITYLTIMQYQQGGVWLAPDLFCSRTLTPKHPAMIIKDYLLHKEEQEVLEVMARPPHALISTSLHDMKMDYMKRGFEEVYTHRRSVVSSPRCLDQPTSRDPSKIPCKCA